MPTLELALRDFHRASAMRRYVDAGADFTDAQVSVLMRRYYAAADRLTDQPCETLAEVTEKAEALRRLLDDDVAECEESPLTRAALALVQDFCRLVEPAMPIRSCRDS